MTTPEARKRVFSTVPSPIGFMLAILIRMIFVVPILALTLIFAVRHMPTFRNRVRRFNRKVVNPTMMPLIGKGIRMFAVVHHVGRKSGRAYSNPVIVDKVVDGFIIPLTYGSSVDWCRNVVAKGQFILSYEGREYNLQNARVIDAHTALPQLRLLVRTFYQWVGFNEFVKAEYLPAS